MTINKIVFVQIDTLRHDCINHIPDKKYLERDNVRDLLQTPTLDSIAKNSICFRRCYTTSSITSAVHATMFTGTTQINHSIRCTTTSTTSHVMNKEVQTFAEILRKHGYLTIFVSESLSILSIPEITRGFDHLFKNEAQLYDFLSKHQDEKIFLFCLFQDVHAPYLYSPVSPYEGYNDDFFETMSSIYSKYEKPFPTSPIEIWSNLYKQVDKSRKLWFPLYVKGVSKFDKGRFKIFLQHLQEFGLYDDSSMLIVSADHGEGKNNPKNDHFEHNGEAYDEIARVPLLVKIPDKKPAMINDLVSNIDIFNIIIEEGLGKHPQDLVNYKIHGINPFKEKRDYAWFIYATDLSKNGTEALLQSRTIITKDCKYILRGRPEIYLNENAFGGNDAAFVRNLYHNLFLRPPNDEIITNYVGKLTKNSFAKNLVKNITNVISSNSVDKYTKKITQGEITQKSLYETFLKSEEYSKKKPFYITDLIRDPFEENEFEPTSNLNYLMNYKKYLPILFNLEKMDLDQNISRTTPSDDDEMEVQQALKELGYL